MDWGGPMNKRRLIVTAGTLGMLWLPGCADPCADDGLLQNMDGMCPDQATADDTDSDGDPDTSTGPDASMDTDLTLGSGGEGDCNDGE